MLTGQAERDCDGIALASAADPHGAKGLRRQQLHLYDHTRKTEAIAIVSSTDGFRADFRRWLERNWTIYLAFEIRALRLIRVGCKHGGAGEIVENIRWQSKLAERESEFKINNNYRADLGRLFEAMHPRHKGFFRSRVRKSLEAA